MSKYFNYFPKLNFDINKDLYSNFETVTNVFFRITMVRETIANHASYYMYVVNDTDRPEVLAEKLYGSPEAHWIILYANDIVDPQVDWPLNSRQFGSYIINKYGSIPFAQTNIHHYEKVVTREDVSSGVTTVTSFPCNAASLTLNTLGVPYDHFDALPDEAGYVDYNINGKTVHEKITRKAVTLFDYEFELNEAKRQIKLIKPEYYMQIMREFNTLTGNAANPFLRKL